MRVSYSTLVKAKRAGRATSVRVAPTGTAVEQYQVPLGNRHSLKEAGVIGLPSWSDRQTQSETWTKVPRLSATCPRRIVAYDGGKSAPGAEVFPLLFDDFDGSVLDAAKWSRVEGSAAEPTNSVLTLSGGASFTSVFSVATFSDLKRYLMRIKTAHFGSTGYEETVISRVSDWSSYMWFAASAAADAGKVINLTGGSSDRAGPLANYTSGQWNRLEYIRNGSSKWTANGGTSSTVSKYYTSTAQQIGFRVKNTGAMVAADWLAVMSIVTSEPLAGTAQPTATNRAISRPLNHAGLIRSCCT